MKPDEKDKVVNELNQKFSEKPLSEIETVAIRHTPDALRVDILELLSDASCLQGDKPGEPQEIMKRAERGLSVVYMLLKAREESDRAQMTVDEKRKAAQATLEKIVGNNGGAKESFIDLVALVDVAKMFAPLVVSDALCDLHKIALVPLALEIQTMYITEKAADRDEVEELLGKKPGSESDQSPPVATGPLPRMPNIKS